MSTATASSRPARSPVRRQRLVASLQALLSNDGVDLDSFRPGSPWPNPGDLDQRHQSCHGASPPTTPRQALPQGDVSVDISAQVLAPATFETRSATDSAIPFEFLHDDFFSGHGVPYWFGQASDSSCLCRTPANQGRNCCRSQSHTTDYPSPEELAAFSSSFSTTPSCDVSASPFLGLSEPGPSSASTLHPWEIAMDEDMVLGHEGGLLAKGTYHSQKEHSPAIITAPLACDDEHEEERDKNEDSLDHGRTTSTRTTHSRQRGDASHTVDQSSSSQWTQHHLRQRRHRPHYVVEKRYRASLNERFEALRNCVELRKASRQVTHPTSPDPAEPEAATIGGTSTSMASKMNKGRVLEEAVAYIEQLEEENEVVLEHMKLVIRRLRATKVALHQI